MHEYALRSMSVLSRAQALAFSVFDLINDLRLHVLLNYLFVVSWFLYAAGVSVKNSVSYALFAMCIGGFAYLLNRYTDYSYDVIVDRGLKKAPRRMYLIFSGAFLFIGIFLCLQNTKYLIPVLIGIALGILYSVRTFFKYPIKNYFLIKNIFAAGSKYIGTMIGAALFVPMSEAIFMRSISLFAFYIIYEILWDIRDMESDAAGKVSTIPLLIGKGDTLFLCGAVWLISLSFQFPAVRLTDHFFLKYIVVLFFILSLVKVRGVRWFHVMVYAHLLLNLVFVNDEIMRYLASMLR